MFLVFILCVVLYLLTVYFSIYKYYEMKKQNEELEKRLLQLEKRIIEFENTIKNDYKGIYVPINEDFKVLLPLCEKDKFNLKSLEYAYNLIKNGEEVEEMACGTKGRPRGRHTTSRGGGRKK